MVETGGSGVASGSACESDGSLLAALNRLIDGVKLSAVRVCEDCRLEAEAAWPSPGGCAELLAKARRLIAAGDGESREELGRVFDALVDECFGGDPAAARVYGEYDPAGHVITLYRGCLLLEQCRSLSWFTRLLGETLAHELVHHLQWTGSRIVAGEAGLEAAVRLDSALAEALAQVPYQYRSHEVEALHRAHDLWRSVLRRDPDVRSRVEAHAAEACQRCGCP